MPEPKRVWEIKKIKKKIKWVCSSQRRQRSLAFNDNKN